MLAMEESSSELSGSYKTVSEIQTSQSYSGDYEYPSYLERTPQSSVKKSPPTQHAPLQANEATQSASKQPEASYKPGYDSSIGESGVYTQPYELVEGEFGGKEAVEPTSESDSDSSDAETKGKRTIIPQLFRSRTSSKTSATLESSERLVIAGNIVDDSTAPLSFKSGVKSQRQSTTWAGGEDLTASLAEQGIYQGLVMTDQEKQRLGILPEAIYMTTNLLKNWASEIENMSLHIQKVSPPARRSSLSEAATPTSTPPPKPFRKRISSSLMKSPKFMKKTTASSTDTRTQRSVVPYYRNCVLRPPPLPPLSPDATRAERKAYAVVENLLKSEAAFLSSLKTAVQVYMSPLREISEGPNPILDFDSVQTLFGPIEDIIRHHELFYSALTSRTLDWTSEQRIGDIFMSSMNTKEVIRHYSAYVNNFTSAMFTLEKAIHKKKSFVKFLRDKYINSNTSLSLQGLLLKPIQRFPQYILFIQDVLKYTTPTHPDRITLQMALARLECIAEYLNEAKKLREQKSVVQNLNTTISRLPFKLSDSDRWLYRQDIVTRLLSLNGQVITKSHRCLLLFNNMVLCAAGKARKKSPKHELESTTGSRDFKGTADIVYTCKWFSPLDKIHLVEPDLLSDIWDKLLDNDNSEEAAEYFRLKNNYKKLEYDFDQMTKIASIVSGLHDTYQGLTIKDIGTHIRVLQRKIANVKEQIKALQIGRVDLTLPSRDGSKRIHHTYRFQSEKIKLEWVNALRYAKLKLSKPNSSSWVIAEDVNDEDIFELTHKLPLFVESCPVNLVDNTSSMMCATRVGLNSAWLAGGNDESAIVMIVACVTPSPIILECFNVDSNRIIDLLYVPPCVQDGTLTSTMRRASLRETLQQNILDFIPPHIATVWLGAQNGRLSIYTAQSVKNGAKKCLSSDTLSDSITSMQYWSNQVFISTAEGSIVIYKRTKAGWDLTNRKTIAVSDATIRCMCVVGNRLWIGVGNLCFFLNMQTHRMEGHMTLNNKEGVVVTRMALWGEGVWISYRGIPAVELFHVITKASLQDINIKDTLHTIIKRRGLESKLPIPQYVHVTSLMASCGFLWIGTSIGAILVYRIPRIKGVPIVSGKPYLSLDSHASAVRVLLYVKTLATYSSTRVGQFLSDEQSRTFSTMTPEEDSIYDMDDEVFGGFPSEEAQVRNGSGLLSDTSSTGKKELESSEESAAADGAGDTGTLKASDPLLEESTTSQLSKLDKSLTPSLPHPSTIMLEESSEVLDRNESATATDSEEVNLRRSQSRSKDKLEEDWQEVVDELEEKKLVVPIKEQQQQHEQNEQLELQDEDGQEQALVVENGAVETNSLAKPVNPVFIENDDGLLCSLTEQHYEFAEHFKTGENQTEDSDLPRSLTESSRPANEDGDGNGVLTGSSLLANGVAVVDGEEVEVSASGIYNLPHELDTVVQPLSSQFEEDGSGIYSIPVVNSSTLTAAAGLGEGEEGPYDFPVELDAVKDEADGKDKANPYESPSTLEIGGPANISPTMFSRQALSSLSAMIPEWSAESKEGAIFILTAGKGLVNLRPGVNSLRRTTANGQDDSIIEESCMMAYEIEV